MRKILFLAIFVSAVAFVSWGVSTQAVDRGFAERFAAAAHKDHGETGTYNFDKNHSFIGFKVKHMGLIEVPGFFRDFTGEVNFNADDVTKSSVSFKAMMTSVDTGVAPRDNHLRTKDFFEVEKFPEMTFKSTKVEKKGKGWVVTGDLTMKGVTKSVMIPFEISGWLPASERAGMKMGIAGETTINRRDFGVNFGNNLPSGVPSLSDDVKVILQIEAGKAKEAAKPAE
ncbi:MAG TPA: YceI family protein [Pyrinomonadaceae bacterium]|nr:YceI family protein [Pyrinomonadaceae bacterium]